MLILDTLIPSEDYTIDIPFYHRGHLSLKSKTKVTIALIPPRQEDIRLTEMVISSIAFDAWPDLWRLEAVFKEQTGIVHRILSIIAEKKFNVLNQESSSIENRDSHAIELILQAPRATLNNQPSETADWKQAQDLERRILALCIDDLTTYNDEPVLSIKRMKGLRAAWNKFNQAKRENEGSSRESGHPTIESATVHKGHIELPHSIKSYFQGNKVIRTLPMSDTKERLLRIFFPEPNIGFTYVKISHEDETGALAQITKQVARGFDIINSLTRIRQQRKQNEFELLLFSNQFPKPSQEKKRQKILRYLLSKQELKGLNLKIEYPDSVGPAGSGGIPPKAPKIPPKFNENDASSNKLLSEVTRSTSEIATEKLAELETRAERELVFSKKDDLRTKIKSLRKVLHEEGIKYPDPKVFLSYNFKETKLRNIVAAKLSSAKIKLITGERPTSQQSNYRDTIIDRISYCDVFIGLWTCDAEHLVSPWLIWELGVAQGLHKPYRLLIQEGTRKNLFLQVNPDQFHETFDFIDFKETVDILVGEIQALIARKAREQFQAV